MQYYKPLREDTDIQRTVSYVETPRPASERIGGHTIRWLRAWLIGTNPETEACYARYIFPQVKLHLQ